MTDTAGAGGGPLRSESARQLTPEIRQSKFPGTPRPSVTLALAAPGTLKRSAHYASHGAPLRDAALANDGNGSPPVARGSVRALFIGAAQIKLISHLDGGAALVCGPVSMRLFSVSWVMALWCDRLTAMTRALPLL